MSTIEGNKMEKLTTEVKKVLIDTANGMSAKVIAGKHGKTQRTVEAQLKHAREVLNASTTSQAVARAIKHGLIKPAEIAVLVMLCLNGVDDMQLRVKRTQPRPPTAQVKRQEYSN
ncbi:MAG: helix-turn-helix transcriptional regulator [Plesiomonas sp.]